MLPLLNNPIDQIPSSPMMKQVCSFVLPSFSSWLRIAREEIMMGCSIDVDTVVGRSRDSMLMMCV